VLVALRVSWKNNFKRIMNVPILCDSEAI